MSKPLNLCASIFFLVLIIGFGFIFVKGLNESSIARSDSRRWELVDSTTERLRIPGGWLVYRIGGMTFVPDMNHEWTLPIGK